MRNICSRLHKNDGEHREIFAVILLKPLLFACEQSILFALIYAMANMFHFI